MPERDLPSAWNVIYGVLVLLVAGLFLVALRPVLSPFALFLVLLLLLWPYAGTRLHRYAVGAAALLTGLWLLETLGLLLAPFVLALVLAYILDPAVDVLEERRVPRGIAIIMLALPVVVVVAVGLVYGVPALLDQLEDLIRSAPVLIERAVGFIERARRGEAGFDLPLVREAVLLERLRGVETERIVTFLQERREQIARQAWEAVLGVGQGIGQVLTILGYVVLTPVLVFYLLRDYDGLTAHVRGLFPEQRRERWLDFLGEYDRLLSSYLRGQVFAALSVGLLTWIGLWILDFPYSGLVGAVAGVFNLVPYLGLIVSLVPALIISFLSGSILLSLGKVAIVFAVVQTLDGTIIGPRIIGGSVGLHPVWVILALALGGFFFGFVGLLLAMPIAVLLKLLLRVGIERYRRSGVYREVSPVDPAAPEPAGRDIQRPEG